MSSKFCKILVDSYEQAELIYLKNLRPEMLTVSAAAASQKQTWLSRFRRALSTSSHDAHLLS